MFKVSVPVKVSGVLSFASGAVVTKATAPAQTVNLQFRGTGSTPYTFTRTLSVPYTGEFSVPDVPVGTYILHIKAVRYLAANVTLDTSTGAAIPGSIDLPGGDIFTDDGSSTFAIPDNNIVDVDDLTSMLFAFNTTLGDGSGLYEANPTADIDQDGKIDVDDLTDLLFNFNVAGAP